MATVEDQLLEIIAKVDTLSTPAAPVVDFTPILTQLTSIEASLAAIAAQLQPTPATSAA